MPLIRVGTGIALLNRPVIDPGVYYAWNPSDKDADITLSMNDTVASITAALGSVRGVTGRDAAGDYYFEITPGGTTVHLIGIAKSTASLATYPGGGANGWSYYSVDGKKYNNNINSAYGASYAVAGVIGVRLAAGVLTFYKNGTTQGTAYSSLSGTFYPIWGPGTGAAGTRTATINTGPSLLYLPSGSTAWG